MTPTRFTRRSFNAIAAAAALCGIAAAHAQQRVIHIVVPFGTGAVQDTVARAFNNELGAALNASAIVENRAGSGGTVGAAIVARAPADGNTLVLAAASHNIAGFLYSKLSYDPLKDFVGVANVGNAGYVLAVSSGMGVSSTADFIKEVKANPGKYNYASAGNGSATHLAMASFLAKAGLQMTHIPTKSTGEAVNEVLAGRVQAVISSSIGVMGFQEDARMKLLASTGQSRSPFLPKLPTVAESGLPGYAFDSWIGLLAHGCTAEVFFKRSSPPTVNHPAEARFAAGVMREVVGDDMVTDDFPAVMGAEDFAHMLLARPGCYAFLGNGDGDHRLDGHGPGPCIIHNTSFDFNDEIIPIGASYFVKLVQRWLPAARA